ncbi:MAG: hypothetical protein M3401_17110 [Actinomycetota bacterium]|nr:hypothetical protein [Actinomycetota bacterium]
MSRPLPIPVLERLGADLEVALRAHPRRSWLRAHPVLAALAAFAALAVPAAGTQVDWARLVNGETALPTQTSPQVRTVLASGRRHEAGAWQLVVYKAALAGGATDRPGLCAYVTGFEGGAGRCVARARNPELLVASTVGSLPGPIGGIVSPRANRIELTLHDGRRLAVAPQRASADLLARRGLPRDLRFFIVDAGLFASAELAGALVRDADGKELARFGRPRTVPSSAPVLSSPVTLSPGRAP